MLPQYHIKMPGNYNSDVISGKACQENDIIFEKKCGGI